MQENNLNKNKPVSKNPPLEGREAEASIYLIGYMASGKTTFGKKLANALQYDFIDLDALIEKEEGISITEIFQTKGEEYFREIENNVLKQTVSIKNAVISCGGGTPCFYNNMDFINNNGLSIWLNPPLGFIIDRIKKEPNQRPLVKGLTGDALKVKVEHHYYERIPFYNKAKMEYNSKLTKESDFINLVKSRITNTN